MGLGWGDVNVHMKLHTDLMLRFGKLHTDLMLRYGWGGDGVGVG